MSDATQEEKSLFPRRDQQLTWGWFGYEGAMCDRAIRADRADMIEEAVTRGWINAKTEMMTGTLLEFCDQRAPKCAAKLRELRVFPCAALQQ